MKTTTNQTTGSETHTIDLFGEYLKAWQCDDDPTMVTLYPSFRGRIRVKRAELAQLVEALGLGDSQRLKQKVIEVISAQKLALVGARRAKNFDLVEVHDAVIRDLLDALREDAGLTKEPGAGIKARNKNNPGVYEFRRMSDGSWVSAVCSYHDDLGLLSQWDVVEVLQPGGVMAEDRTVWFI